MTNRNPERRTKKWAEGLENKTGSPRSAQDKPDDGPGNVVVSGLVDVLSTLAGKWMDYDADRVHNKRSA